MDENGSPSRSQNKSKNSKKGSFESRKNKLEKQVANETLDRFKFNVEGLNQEDTEEDNKSVKRNH